ncbi:MAG: peptidoglycan editing factor PgeF [Proteobacteria bacterium]|nr:peptidoglycan editing factor PgeF [Pseudomonadota bacterium]
MFTGNDIVQTQIGDLTYLRFKMFQAFPDISHAMFTRKGGKSASPFDSLNVGENVGDDPKAVVENRKTVLAVTGGKTLVSLRQVHGTDVLKVVHDKGLEDIAPEADALITNRPDIDLLIKVADCQPVFLYDYKNHVIANVHSGWRGSVNNVLGKTVQEMKTAFCCDPKTILAGIGPSLGPCCSEFVNFREEIPEHLWSYRDESDHFDFWKMSRDQLIDEGLTDSQISVAGLCTRCLPDLFYSYRGEQITGRLACVIGLREKGNILSGEMNDEH